MSLADLLSASDKVGKQLTKDFYVSYANMRQEAFESLCEVNAGESRHGVLAATQKVLDRVLFTAFCEDRGLLPDAVLRRAFEHRDPFNPRPVWENFRGLFRSINAGNEALQIPAYNGGLFADDALIDRLNVPDAVCAHFRDLGEYEYRSAHDIAVDETSDAHVIDVDILGHIFEQSITDLEQLRNELDGLVAPLGKEKHKTRRKKEGAFYTPPFITRYIVEQSLGAVLADRFEKLRQAHAGEASGTAAKALADPRAYDLESLNKPQRDALIRFWEAWEETLISIRLLDPACGSGAFLIEAFDQMHAALQQSNDRLVELRGHQTLFDLDRQILQNNLYGVDLNEEAIEICRLSLWIKTASRGRMLTSLDHNIRVGNSVVDDSQVHPKAFDWRTAFPEVFASGGFDVIVANPPYIRQEWLAPYKSYWQRRFKSYAGAADIFTYFYELGVELLRDGGRLGFITSGSWVFSNFGSGLRGFLAENSAIDSMIDFGEFQPFEAAEMIRPTITVLSKKRRGEPMRLFKWLTAGYPPENLSETIASSRTMRTDLLGSEAWTLEPDEVICLRDKMHARGKTLLNYCGGNLLYGVKTGLNEVFVINGQLRNQLIALHKSSGDIIKPFRQGSQLRPWSIECADQYLLFTRRGIAIQDYPAVLDYLSQYRDRLEPQPTGWNISRDGKWQGRKAGSYEWYEIQDTVDYWEAFERTKIVWPDITNRPRFSMDAQCNYVGDTGFVVPLDDYYLLGVLASWATWFLISKSCQPLRLRSDRWQYRLKKQWLAKLPVPEADNSDQQAVASLARHATTVGQKCYEIQESLRRRIRSTFGVAADGTPLGDLNQKAEAWWECSLQQLGAALKASFKLSADPFKNPRTADEWEPYLVEKQAAVHHLARELADTEAELNDRVYRLFQLTPDEIKLLQREVEH